MTVGVAIFVGIGIGAIIGYFIGRAHTDSHFIDAIESQGESLRDSDRWAKVQMKIAMVHKSISHIVLRRFEDRLEDWYPKKVIRVRVNIPEADVTEIEVKIGNRTALIESSDLLEQLTFGQEEKETFERLLK